MVSSQELACVVAGNPAWLDSLGPQWSLDSKQYSLCCHLFDDDALGFRCSILWLVSMQKEGERSASFHTFRHRIISVC